MHLVRDAFCRVFAYAKCSVNWFVGRISKNTAHTDQYHFDTFDTLTPKILFLYIFILKKHNFPIYANIFKINFRENEFLSVRSVKNLENKGGRLTDEGK